MERFCFGVLAILSFGVSSILLANTPTQMAYASAPFTFVHSVIVGVLVPVPLVDKFVRFVAEQVWLKYTLQFGICLTFRYMSTEINWERLVAAFALALASFSWSRLISPAINLQYTYVLALCLGFSKNDKDKIFIPCSTFAALFICMLNNYFEYRDTGLALQVEGGEAAISVTPGEDRQYSICSSSPEGVDTRRERRIIDSKLKTLVEGKRKVCY
ncbi:conserved hypothetical protein [Ricinus communis]|uniref:Uncharacterized protein n=1 Tax=Ricinus communis TaxID=3988 RepID=B9SR20_RICCO|nr:conserved hypothetical protein [Ricinus communis]